jgi:hypothetical protein
MSRSYTSSPPSASMACSGTALPSFKMFKTAVAFLLGLLLFLVYYLRDCTGFECSVANPIFPISPVIFIVRNSITR